MGSGAAQTVETMPCVVGSSLCQLGIQGWEVLMHRHLEKVAALILLFYLLLLTASKSENSSYCILCDPHPENYVNVVLFPGQGIPRLPCWGGISGIKFGGPNLQFVHDWDA